MARQPDVCPVASKVTEHPALSYKPCHLLLHMMLCKGASELQSIASLALALPWLCLSDVHKLQSRYDVVMLDTSLSGGS